MSKTKLKILAAALRQFNDLGTDAVTVRSVADEVGISHGNLCYHFKNTDVLIEALYLQLVEETSQIIEITQDPATSLPLLYEQLEASFRLLYRFRFLMLDFVRINRRIPAIREHFRQLMALRRVQFRITMQNLMRAGFLRPVPDDKQYERLILQAMILSDAWITRAEILHDEAGEPIIQFYSDLVGSLLVPYLTDKGWEAYRAMRKGQGVEWLEK